MHREPTLDDHPTTAPRRRRLLLWLGVPALLLLVPVGLYLLVVSRSNASLRALVAELDRTDPHWRLEEIEEHRAVLTDEENAAVTVLSVKKKLPLNWPAPPPAPPAAEAAREPDKEAVEGDNNDAPLLLPDANPLALLAPLDQRIVIPPETQLDDALTKDLRAELEKAKDALAVADALADQKIGRFPLVLAPNPINTTLRCQDAREVAALFRYQALLQNQDGRPDAALRTARGLLGSGRAIGDEPTLISMLVRIAIHAIAVASVERTLAQGSPSAEALAALQRELEVDEAENLLHAGYRGERGFSHAMMLALKSGQASSAGLIGSGPATGTWRDRLEEKAGSLLAYSAHPRLLKMLTQCVEIAKLPPHEQKAPLDQLVSEVKQLTVSDYLVCLLMPAVSKVASAAWRDKAVLRCAIAAVAAERFRLARGRWPNDLQELTPTYLAAVALDPYDGKPLRFKRVADGLLIYSVGPDGKDDGGAFNRQQPTAKGTDLVFRLWDVGRRRQAPAEALPEPAFGFVGFDTP